MLRTIRQKQEELIQFVVHDLRAPLTVMLTGLEVLQDVASESPDQAQQSLIRGGITAGKRMLTLINSLVDLSRLESGQMPLHIEPVDVRELVDSSLEQVTLWAARNQVALTTDIDPGLGTVQADHELTLRVLVNLLSNAIKFSPPQSTVLVRVVPSGADALAFSVVDQGPGIPKEWTRKVFDKFVQVEAYQAGVKTGSGLGLSFCRLAVEAQGGSIWLESQFGQGTTATFTLPVARV
jgi:signal transduction histidine kinase